MKKTLENLRDSKDSKKVILMTVHPKISPNVLFATIKWPPIVTMNVNRVNKCVISNVIEMNQILKDVTIVQQIFLEWWLEKWEINSNIMTNKYMNLYF